MLSLSVAMEEKVFHLNFNYMDKLSSYFILVNLFVLKSLKLDWLTWILTALLLYIVISKHV